MNSSGPARWTLGMVVAAQLSGCAAPDDERTEGRPPATKVSENGLSSINGLSAINGLSSINGLSAINGLSSINGLSAINGLSSINGLSGIIGRSSRDALMATAAGRETMSYLVRCALPAGHGVSWEDHDGRWYRFAGQIGVAPEWEQAPCATSACQENVTACLLAHVNAAGVHVPLWLDGSSPALEWGRNGEYPYQEGAFYGNLFMSPPKAYYCEGDDVERGVVPGRLGAADQSAVYVNPLGRGVLCRDRCAAVDAPHGGDGFESCPGIGGEVFTHVITVWRSREQNPPGNVSVRPRRWQ